ncbi:hypothetical protein J5N97_018919 [Dioscorea zingiberensis]|uniref:Uncharacterized protein n=1 Tax=Dioscorea zingiberensis TaxID=325984 RepID=A0A9D5CEW8_9LILI|nr:hypothetical protein J5N97_018919 [Dioscorea zingiberensis]
MQSVEPWAMANAGKLAVTMSCAYKPQANSGMLVADICLWCNLIIKLYINMPFGPKNFVWLELYISIHKEIVPLGNVCRHPGTVYRF